MDMIKKNSTPVKTKEEKYREIVTKAAVCQSQICPMQTNCLRSILKDYVPENYPLVMSVNLRNLRMQRSDCPQYCPSEPVRMPLGLSQMYYDMPVIWSVPSRTASSASLPASATTNTTAPNAPLLPISKPPFAKPSSPTAGHRSPPSTATSKNTCCKIRSHVISIPHFGIRNKIT